MNEDPVCGSGTGSVGTFIRQWGQHNALGAKVIASQGSVLGRSGIVRLKITDASIKVAGTAVTFIDGQLII